MKSSSGDEPRDRRASKGDGERFPHRDGDGRMASIPPIAATGYSGWRFVTNHAHVLQTIAGDPSTRLRDVAVIVGITERTAAQIVDDLVQAGYVTKTRDGRRNRYEIHTELPLRHSQHRHRTIGELIRFLEPPEEP
jgi:DNA-binding transcriptional ArsR family regulator